MSHPQDDGLTNVSQAVSSPTQHSIETRRQTFSQSKNSIFGSFWIDSIEFALPVGAIREVVNEPHSISAVPLAPPHLKGLFNLRGMIIPIVDLRILLNLPKFEKEETSEDGRKVAIIENANKCIGILFDRPGEVLNEPGSAQVRFSEDANGVKDVVIDGVLKLDNGNRMVQIIDPYEILKIERVPKAEAAELDLDQQAHLGKRLSCVSFQLGHTCCAIDLRYVQEVRDMPPIDKSLIAHGHVIGTVNLRGIIIPVVDFRSYMGKEAAYKLSESALSQRKLLVMKSDGGLIGLMVYSIDSIIPFFEGEVLPFAKLALPRADVVSGCLVNEDEQLVMLLDHSQLMSDPNLAEPAKSCHDIYNSFDQGKEDASQAQSLERKTYILFSVSTRFAMDTLHVSEVIDKPSELLEPPYALSFVEGIVNLRGELITLVNLRQLYGLEAFEEEQQKVVIFKHAEQKYAILVDSVDEIVMTTEDKVSQDNKKPNSSGAIRAASKDVSGVLHVSHEGKGDHMVMIMDVEAVVARCIGIAN